MEAIPTTSLSVTAEYLQSAEKTIQLPKVKRLQRLLLRSRAAQALAVKQVTQLNTGRKSPELMAKPHSLLKSA